MNVRDVANMNMDIGILRGLAINVEESAAFDLMTCALDNLEEIAQKMLDEVEGGSEGDGE